MVIKRVIAVLVMGAVLVVPSVASANAAAGAVTDRSVFTLSAAGAAKLSAAEKNVAQAVKILGKLGKLVGPVATALVLYDISTDVWDWWNQEYDAGSAGEYVGADNGSWGVTTTGDGVLSTTARIASSGAYVGQWACGSPPSYAYGNTITVVGESITRSGSEAYCNGVPFMVTVTWYYMQNSTLPTGPTQAAPGGTDRAGVISAIDDVLSSVNAQRSKQDGAINAATLGGQSGYDGMSQSTLSNLLHAARDYISNGVSMASGVDYTAGSGYSAGNPALPGNSRPESVAEPAPSVDLSPVTSAVSALSSSVQGWISAAEAAITSAISASQAAVASAVSASEAAIASAVSASQAAVETAVAGVASQVAAIPVAISAVASQVAAIPDLITGSKDAVIAEVDSKAQALSDQIAATSGGGSGADVVAELQAQDQAAQDAAVAAAAPSFACPTCARTTEWSTLMQSWQAAAAGAPIFALIGNLAWPGSGTVQRSWSVGSWMGNNLSVDLGASGIDTVITVVRFVVIGGAVIVAYMIIFG
ncbi:MAG: hypothetical protein C3F12_00170 [Candidatus Methylomirabilota bacterium]|nr:hypothetical protein [Candidatus Methylomirabilis sp.]NJD68499.1 hypothetical protein [candidate division NC10 bacterium]PWB48951.1 MAG: hypothetical protein C3F12_00170 [candidate division NC10 bacterium]